MIRRADERAPILQGQRDTLAHALIHRLGLPRDAQLAFAIRRKELRAAILWESLDRLRGPVGEQDRRSLGDAGCTAVADGVEAERLERVRQIQRRAGSR